MVAVAGSAPQLGRRRGHPVDPRTTVRCALRRSDDRHRRGEFGAGLSRAAGTADGRIGAVARAYRPDRLRPLRCRPEAAGSGARSNDARARARWDDFDPPVTGMA